MVEPPTNMTSTPIFSAVFAVVDASATLKLSGSMRAAIRVDFFVVLRRVLSTGPGPNLRTGLDEFVNETVVDVDLRTLCRIVEFAPQPACGVAACSNHHIIL